MIYAAIVGRRPRSLGLLPCQSASTCAKLRRQQLLQEREGCAERWRSEAHKIAAHALAIDRPQLVKRDVPRIAESEIAGQRLVQLRRVQ